VTLPEEPSKITSSAAVGTVVSAPPPEVVDHVEFEDQLPPAVLAYLTVPEARAGVGLWEKKKRTATAKRQKNTASIIAGLSQLCPIFFFPVRSASYSDAGGHLPIFILFSYYNFIQPNAFLMVCKISCKGDFTTSGETTMTFSDLLMLFDLSAETTCR